MIPLPRLSPHSGARGFARIFHCFGRAITAGCALPRAAGFFILNRRCHEAAPAVRSDVLRGASDRHVAAS